MSNERNYQVVLLPKMEVVEQACTLGEAQAWIRAYNEVIGGSPTEAVIAQKNAGREAV